MGEEQDVIDHQVHEEDVTRVQLQHLAARRRDKGTKIKIKNTHGQNMEGVMLLRSNTQLVYTYMYI